MRRVLFIMFVVASTAIFAASVVAFVLDPDTVGRWTTATASALITAGMAYFFRQGVLSDTRSARDEPAAEDLRGKAADGDALPPVDRHAA